MKAEVIHHYGGPEELKYEEFPKPDLNPEDVLVKVYASGVNPVDWKVRQGGYNRSKEFVPRILGWDFSGVIEQVGASAGNWKKGDEVYGRPDISRNGTYAEYVAVRGREIARLIDSGGVIPVVSRIFPLKEAAAAQRLSEEGHVRGKIVLQVVEDENA